ncbi:MAG: hypothetical protein M3O22_00740 [Pseudomonadota bacterium]|nr:hypothetical protein [Pseudomonadota bacterium]
MVERLVAAVHDFPGNVDETAAARQLTEARHTLKTALLKYPAQADIDRIRALMNSMDHALLTRFSD